MLLYEVLLIKYPTVNLLKDVKLQDDGQGAYIKEWGMINTPQPSQEDINTWMSDPMVLQQHIFTQNTLANKAIYDQLDAIDAKSIRPLRENDPVMLASLMTQATALRAQLLPVK